MNNDDGEATFKQLKKYGETFVLHPLNSKYEDIELKKGDEYRIVGKIVEKKKRYCAECDRKLYRGLRYRRP